MDWIHKFCKKEHNIKVSPTCLVGNLYKYRDIENPELADAEEGLFRYSIAIPRVTRFSRAWCNIFFGSAFRFSATPSDPQINVPGYFNMTVTDTIFENDGPDHILASGQIEVEYHAPNSWMFCASIGDSDFACPFPGYNDVWSFRRQSATDFAIALAQRLGSHVTLGHIDNPALTSLPILDVRSVSIDVRHGPVNYVDRHINIEREEDFSVADLEKLLLDAPFTKPVSYRPESEYRFLFEVTINNCIFSVEKQDIIVWWNQIQRYVK